MPIFLNRLAFLVLIISGFLLSGCSYYEFFYVHNATDRKVTAIIKFNEPWRSWQCEDYPPDSNSILNCQVRDILAKKLKFKALDGLTISVDLPANSKTYIGRSTNKPLTADSVILIKDDRKEYYSFMDIYKQCKIPGVPFNHRATYRID